MDISLEVDDSLYEKIKRLSNGDIESFVKRAIEYYIEKFKPIKIDYDSLLRTMARSSCMVNPGSIINVKLTDEELNKIEKLIDKSGMRVHHFIKEAIKDYIYKLNKNL